MAQYFARFRESSSGSGVRAGGHARSGPGGEAAGAAAQLPGAVAALAQHAPRRGGLARASAHWEEDRACYCLVRVSFYLHLRLDSTTIRLSGPTKPVMSKDPPSTYCFNKSIK